MRDASYLGRLHLSTALDLDATDLLRELTRAWEATVGGRALVPSRRVDPDMAGESLRHAMAGLLKPLGIRVQGAVVLVDDDGGLSMVTARNGRVTTKVLWTGGSDVAPRVCSVIDLDAHRAERR